jgi:hypothetical protein
VALLTPLLGTGGRALDLLEREMAELYVLPVEKNGMSWQDLAVFNWGDRTAGRNLDLLKLGYTAGEKLHIFDFWQKSHRIAEAGVIPLGAIPSHGCRLLRICKVEDRPLLVGDTLHITQGCELESWQVTGKTLEVKTIDLGRRVEGSLWLSLPGRIVSATCGTGEITYEKENSLYRLPLDFPVSAGIVIKWE